MYDIGEFLHRDDLIDDLTISSLVVTRERKEYCLEMSRESTVDGRFAR